MTDTKDKETAEIIKPSKFMRLVNRVRGKPRHQPTLYIDASTLMREFVAGDLYRSFERSNSTDKDMTWFSYEWDIDKQTNSVLGVTVKMVLPPTNASEAPHDNADND